MRARDFRLEASDDVFDYAITTKVTRLFNSLSLLFPQGEKFFANSIRYYENLLPDDLVAEAKLFYKEEGAHSREHRKLNEQLKIAGFNTDKLEQDALKKLQAIGNNPPRALIVTACLELCTAYGADLLLAFESIIFKKSSYSELWKWHAKEESGYWHRTISHKVLEYVHPLSKIEMVIYFIVCVIFLLLQTTENYIELSKY